MNDILGVARLPFDLTFPLAHILSYAGYKGTLASSIVSALALVVGFASASGFIGNKWWPKKSDRSEFQASRYGRVVSFGLYGLTLSPLPSLV